VGGSEEYPENGCYFSTKEKCAYNKKGIRIYGRTKNNQKAKRHLPAFARKKI
jgi:hypothetical protein